MERSAPRRLILLVVVGVFVVACRDRFFVVPIDFFQEFQPNVHGRGGRIVAVTLNPNNDQVVLAATHSGGLFRTIDGGQHWRHLDQFAPNRLWDVRFDPSDPNVVIATVVIDTHNPWQGGIWRSMDGGMTWSRPAAANFADCGTPSFPAYGRWIGFGPPGRIFVATDCGLALSSDHGNTWLRVVPQPTEPAVSSVIARRGPNFATNSNDLIVDVCGRDGPQRSIDGGATFGARTAAVSFPRSLEGFCYLAGSPDEIDVLFAAQKIVNGSEGILWESDDGGRTWTILTRTGTIPIRYPWVRTVRRPAQPPNQFDLVFHNGSDIFVTTCTSGVAGRRCAGTLQGFGTPPHDYGGMAFLPNGCPRYAGLDFGVIASADCGAHWDFRNDGLEAGLSIYDLAGTILPGHTDLYFGTQDNWIWASPDGGASWAALSGAAEGWWLQAPRTATAHGQARVTFHNCSPCVRNVARDHLTGAQGWPLASDQNAPTRGGPPFVIPGDATTARFVEAVGSTLWLREPTGQWRELAPALPDLATSELFVGGPSSDPTLYAVTSRANGTHGLVHVNGLLAANLTVTDVSAALPDVGYWGPDDNPGKFPFAVGVAPLDGRFAMVADVGAGAVLRTTDGGQTWFEDRTLTALVTDNGRLEFHSPFHGTQAHVLRYNPTAAQHLLVGTEASGVMESCDGGTTWRRIQDSAQASAVSDFFFDASTQTVYVATYGRGLWRITYSPRGRSCWQNSVTPPTITVPAPTLLGFTVIVGPAGDPGRVDIGIDGATWLTGAGSGATTGLRSVAPGLHQLRVQVSPAFNPTLYQVQLDPPCGTTSVTVAANQRVSCLVRVTRR